MRHRSSTSFAARFGDKKMSREPVIGVGDSIVVTIWEASSGGLFSSSAVAGQVGSGSNSAQIPEQVVGRDGGITVPYAGRIRVSGQTTRSVQQTIEKSLQGKAIQPQVLVTVTHAASNSVSVGGEVANGARVPLSVGGDRLLDVIASAGGVRVPVNETFVELSRGATTTRVPLTRVIANPSENIYLHPSDVVTLVRDPQTFIARGATGRNDEIPFNADGISLSQALAKAGGLEDSRSDRSGAALQIARLRGARIIVTASTPEKRALAVALGAEHAFDSRSGAFCDGVMRVTDRRGVSVVLNSLAGELMERSLGLLEPFGRFIELGKRDYLADTPLGSSFSTQSSALETSDLRSDAPRFGERLAASARRRVQAPTSRRPYRPAL